MKTVTEVAEILGVCRTTVWYHIRSMGLGRMTGSVMLLDSIEVEKVRGRTLAGQRSSGMITTRQLMDETGLSREVIARRIRRLGIKTKERRRTLLTAEQADQVRRMGDDDL